MDMQEWVKDQKQSNQSRDQQPQQQEHDLPQAQLSKTPLHLQNSEQIAAMAQLSRSRLLDSGRFKWDQEFKGTIDVQVLETNFEEMRVRLHYGNYKMEILVIYTEIDERVFEHENSERGAFGIIRFIQFQQQNYAVKGIHFQYREGDIDADSAYKEYFMCCVADVIETGPKIFPLLGYDILVTKTMIFFCMEECKPIKAQNPQLIKSELITNLKAMHSIKFAHNDIKPQNIAFSSLLKKHVFIDFGLSKLIKEPAGQKTKTTFTGTLGYCSEQMKKCYFFKKVRLVDLYENDVCCLEKTNNRAQHLSKVKDLLKDDDKFEIQQQDKTSVFQQILQIVRLKYFIRNENVKKVLSIIATTKNIRAVYELFQSSHIPKTIAKDQNIRHVLNSIKDRALSMKLQTDSIDYMLCKFFCEEKRVASAEKIIPISQILSSSPEFFSKYLVKTQLILKLFLFFQPFSETAAVVENKCELKRIIVEKIYEMKNLDSLDHVFFFEKVRFTLVYFYEKLRSLKNLKVMLSIRLLFISIQEEVLSRNMEEQIIDMIEDPFLKILKITEFVLFRFASQWYEKDIFGRWTEVIKKLPSNLDDLRYQKVKKLFLIVSPWNFEQRQYLKQTLETRFQEIAEISRECFSPFEKQSINFIKYLYISLCSAYYFVFQLDAPKGVAMKIYLRESIIFRVQLESSEEEEQKIFWPYYLEFRNNFRLYSCKNTTKILVQNQFQILKKRNQPLKPLFEQFQVYNHINKQMIEYLLLGVRYSFLSNIEPITIKAISEKVACLNMYLQFRLAKSKQEKENDKTQKQNQLSIFNELDLLFNNFVQDQKVKECVRNFPEMRIGIETTKIKLGFEKGLNAEQMKPKIDRLVDMMQPFHIQPVNILRVFLTINQYLTAHLHQPQPHYSKSLQLHICQQYIQKKQFHVFEAVRLLPHDYIIFNKENGDEAKIMNMILQLIQYYRTRKEKKERRKKENREGYFVEFNDLPILVFVQILHIFCVSLAKDKLVGFYQKLLRDAGKKQYKCGLYAYLIFRIFIRVKPLISRPNQLSQITTTTICLKIMPALCQLNTKCWLMEMYRTAIILKSKRKAFILSRLEGRYFIEQGKLKIFGKELHQRLDDLAKGLGKVREELRERVLGKLGKRLRKIMKLGNVDA